MLSDKSVVRKLNRHGAACGHPRTYFYAIPAMRKEAAALIAGLVFAST